MNSEGKSGSYYIKESNGEGAAYLKNDSQYVQQNLVSDMQMELQKLKDQYQVNGDQGRVIYKDEFKDKLTLSPLKKYAKYGKFPFKLLIHIGLIVFTTLQIDSTQQPFTPYSRNQDQQWLNIFYDDESASSSNGIYSFYTIQDLQKHFKSLFENLNGFNDNYFQSINLDSADIFLSYAPTAVTEKDTRIEFQDEPIDPKLGILKPFNQNTPKSIKRFLDKTHFFKISIHSLALTLQRDSHPFSCWDFNIEYRMISATFIQSLVQAYGKECPNGNEHQTRLSSLLFQGQQTFIIFAILSLATISSFLAFKYIFDMIQDYMIFKKKGQILIPKVNSSTNRNLREDSQQELIQILSEQRPWDELTYKEKRSYFDLWFVVILLGNICQISSSLFILLQFGQNSLVSRLSEPFRWLQGMGCSLAWLTALKYFDYVSSFNITSELIKRSFPKIGKHFIGFIPILSSFVIIGMTSFGGSQRFATMRDSFATLFSLLLGDSIHDITDDIGDNGISSVLGIFYIISFIIVFMLAVNNIMIAIIQEEVEKRKNKLEKEKAFKKMEKYKKMIEQAKKNQEERLKAIRQNNINDDSSSPEKLNPLMVSSFDSQEVIHSRSISKMKGITGLHPRDERDIPSAQLSETEKHAFENQSEEEEEEQKQQINSPLSRSIGEIKGQDASPLKHSQEKMSQQITSFQSKNLEDLENPFAEKDQSEKEISSIAGLQFKQQSQQITQIVKQPLLKKSKSQQAISEQQQNTISLKALTKVAIQLKKQKKNAQNRINVQEQYKKEVELLTEQKIQCRQIYKQFKKGFNEIINILDKQAYEIKDNLYLYKLSKEQHIEIVKKYCDTLTYFLIRSKVEMMSDL